MPRAHQYHQPNAPDLYGEDPDSDFELDLHELGPRQSVENIHSSTTRNSRSKQQDVEVSDPIPLRSLRRDGLRASGRRRPPDGGRTVNNPDLNEDEEGPRGMDGEDSSEAYRNIGDATPLLLSGSKDVQNKPSTGGLFHRIITLSKFLSRRPGYTSLEAPGQAQAEETKPSGSPRTFHIGQPPPRFPPNAISNAKYTPWSFLPRTLYNEFSFFINMYFLLVALSQLIPPLRIGILWTYLAPLAFVLTVTLGKEAFDDIARRRRDAEANKEIYTILRLRDNSKSPRKARKSNRAPQKSRTRAVSVGQRRIDAIEEEEVNIGQKGPSVIEVDEVRVKSRDLKVGDVLKLGKDQRVPADLVILKSYTTATSVSGVQTSNKEEQDLLAEQSPNHSSSDSATPQTTPPSSTASGESSQGGDNGGSGETFIRTDQLDGETDWKLRLASPLTQSLDVREFVRLSITAGPPSQRVNEFVGSVEMGPLPGSVLIPENGTSMPKSQITSAPLSIDNTAWANTVLASSATVLGVVVYTGIQTRQALSTSSSRSKVGLLELEINNLTKFLCILTLTLSGVLVALAAANQRLEQKWYIALTRFLILFSSIIPISLRVNLDLGKTVYAYFIERDLEMPGAVVRTSTIPEDLGRIEYLLSDKTGTLTQNEMDLKKIHVGTVSYANEAMEEVSSYIKQGFSNISSTDVNEPAMLVTPASLLGANPNAGTGTRTRREIGTRVRDVVLALALCHNVTPTAEVEDGQNVISYQASSPDEIAIVKWTESVGLRVVHRDRHSIALQSVTSSRIAVRVKILDVFPFTSDSKRMGIIVHFLQGNESSPSSRSESGEIWFYQKGADTVMTNIVAANDWLDEETANMAREGLRTLVVGRRKLSPQQYDDFANAYKTASLTLQSRDALMAQVLRDHLEHNLELLGVTGVEDKLQKDVKSSLELLRNAGIKIWMLTGDKVETARCVAISSKLVSRTQTIHTITSLAALARTNPTAPSSTLALLAANPSSTALLIDGDSLTYLLTHNRHAFISLAVLLPAVIACRCSPTQKASIALLIRQHTRKKVAAIGDGGNDVSMIQAADVGVGIVGKEGRQASLAADFSITHFHHLPKLLVWHGRNSYKRSAKLAQFVIHRGLLISVAQTVFSVAAGFEPNGLFKDWLIVGYATLYTQFPVFSLVLDRDVDEGLARLYPELYRELTPGTSLSYRTFLVWLVVSVYQGALVQILAQFLTRSYTSPAMIAVAFTCLVINELGMVAMEVTTWHWVMWASILGTAVIYAGSVPLLGAYFDLAYVWSWGFVWRVVAICAGSLVPVWVIKVVRRTVRPPSSRKVRGV